MDGDLLSWKEEILESVLKLAGCRMDSEIF